MKIKFKVFTVFSLILFFSTPIFAQIDDIYFSTSDAKEEKARKKAKEKV